MKLIQRIKEAFRLVFNCEGNLHDQLVAEQTELMCERVRRGEMEKKANYYQSQFRALVEENTRYLPRVSFVYEPRSEVVRDLMHNHTTLYVDLQPLRSAYRFDRSIPMREVLAGAWVQKARDDAAKMVGDAFVSLIAQVERENAAPADPARGEGGKP